MGRLRCAEVLATLMDCAIVVLLVVFLLLFVGTAFGGEPVFEETLVGEVGPPVVNYYTPLIQELAKKEKRPLVLFRGGAKPRHIVRARCCYDFPNAKPDILVAAVADPAQMSACLPADATDEQIYEAVKKSIAGFVMHAPAATAPHCTGQGCDCGVYGGTGNGCGCQPNNPAADCPRPIGQPVAPASHPQYQPQPLQLHRGLIYGNFGGCANGSCSGSR